MIEGGFDVEATADWIRTERSKDGWTWRPRLAGLEQKYRERV